MIKFLCKDLWTLLFRKQISDVVRLLVEDLLDFINLCSTLDSSRLELSPRRTLCWFKRLCGLYLSVFAHQVGVIFETVHQHIRQCVRSPHSSPSFEFERKYDTNDAAGNVAGMGLFGVGEPL